MPNPGEDALKIQKQERFCLGVTRGLTQKEAYAAAGYKGNPRALSTQVFQKPEVQARLKFLQDRLAEKTVDSAIVDRGEVIEGLRTNWHEARKGTEVLGRDGAGSGVFKPDFAAVNKALESLGKTMGLFIDVQREENLDAELDGKSPEELKQIVLALLQGLDPNLAKKLEAQLDAATDAEVIEIESGGQRLQ